MVAQRYWRLDSFRGGAKMRVDSGMQTAATSAHGSFHCELACAVYSSTSYAQQ